MRIVKSVAGMQQLARKLPEPVVLVPTMGALHEGHLSLVTLAKKMAGRKGSTVASIFVNPTQFGPREDFRKYPRPFKRDCLLLQKTGCELVFAPASAEMYRPGLCRGQRIPAGESDVRCLTSGPFRRRLYGGYEV